LLLLLQETAAKIGPVDLVVTIDAVKRGIEVPLAMTLGAQLSAVPSDEHKSVGRPMGSMADTASLFFLGKMLENPRASLLRMTVETGLLLSIDACLPQTSPFAGSVRSMAV
jgi:hypothetical protein